MKAPLATHLPFRELPVSMRPETRPIEQGKGPVLPRGRPACPLFQSRSGGETERNGTHPLSELGGVDIPGRDGACPWSWATPSVG